MIKTILLAIMLLVASSAITAAEDAPSIWMEQEGDTIKLMVNTSDASMGAQVTVNFESANINITDVDFTNSPWPPFGSETGWVNHGSQIIIALMETNDVSAGEYQMATMTVDCITPGDTLITLTDVAFEGATPIVYNLDYNCPEIVVPTTEATVSIGDGSGDVTLPIEITNAGSAGACDVIMTFDPTSVTVTDVQSGDMEYTYINIADIPTGSIRIGAYQGVAPGLDNFTLASVTLAPVAGGSTCDLTLTVMTLIDDTIDCTDIPYTVSSGTYTIVLMGDVDGTVGVTLGDAAYIAGYVIGLYDTIDEAAADVNGDGVVTIADAMYLAKCILLVPGFEI